MLYGLHKRLNVELPEDQASGVRASQDVQGKATISPFMATFLNWNVTRSGCFQGTTTLPLERPSENVPRPTWRVCTGSRGSRPSRSGFSRSSDPTWKIHIRPYARYNILIHAHPGCSSDNSIGSDLIDRQVARSGSNNPVRKTAEF